MYLVDRANGSFTSQEWERLAVYRAAVQAGFYTDSDPNFVSSEDQPERSAESAEPSPAADAEPGATPDSPER